MPNIDHFLANGSSDDMSWLADTSMRPFSPTDSLFPIESDLLHDITADDNAQPITAKDALEQLDALKIPSTDTGGSSDAKSAAVPESSAAGSVKSAASSKSAAAATASSVATFSVLKCSVVKEENKDCLYMSRNDDESKRQTSQYDSKQLQAKNPEELKCKIDMYEENNMHYLIERQRPNVKVIKDTSLREIDPYPGNYARMFKNKKIGLVENEDFWINNVRGRWGQTKDIGHIFGGKDTKYKFITDAGIAKIIARGKLSDEKKRKFTDLQNDISELNKRQKK